MSYRILVLKNNKHLFATAPESINGRYQLKELFIELSRKFPTEEGCQVLVSQWETSGKPIPPSEFL